MSKDVLPWLRRHVFALAIVLALPVIFFTFAFVVHGLTPDSRPALALPWGGPCLDRAHRAEQLECLLPRLSQLSLTFEWHRPPPGEGEPAVRPLVLILADDLKARYGFAIPAALLLFVSLPILGVGLTGLAQQPWRGWLAVAVVLTPLAILAGLYYQDGHSVRLLAAELMLWRVAVDPHYPYFTPEDWAFAFYTVDLVMAAGMACATVLLALFAALAVRSSPGRLSPSTLRQRVKWFKTALGLGSVVLILAVATTHGLFHWSSALLAPGAREPLQSLASSSALYWGVIHSLTLVMAAVPTVASIRLDAEAMPAGKGDADAVLKEAGMAFDLRHALVTLMTAAGPLMTGPALDLLDKLGAA